MSAGIPLPVEPATANMLPAPQSEDDIKAVVERARRRREKKTASQDLGSVQPNGQAMRNGSHELRSRSNVSSDAGHNPGSDYYQ